MQWNICLHDQGDAHLSIVPNSHNRLTTADEKKALDALLQETKELHNKNISTLEQLRADQEKESRELKDCLEKSKTEIQNLQKSLNNMSSKLREQEAGFTKVNDERKALDAKLNEKKEVEDKKFRIPDVLLKSNYGEQVKLAAELARKGAWKMYRTVALYFMFALCTLFMISC